MDADKVTGAIMDVPPSDHVPASYLIDLERVQSRCGKCTTVLTDQIEWFKSAGEYPIHIYESARKYYLVSNGSQLAMIAKFPGCKCHW